MATDETRTYYHCGCNDETEHPTVRHPPIHAYLASVEEELGEDGEKEEKPFDPKAPLSAFSLSPLQNLLFCEECQQIRCDRCTLQEIITYYCPHCLYETPTSLVKGEGTRCGRGCFSCPVCACVLNLDSLNSSAGPPKATTSSSSSSATLPPPYILNCHYCHWNTLELGITFSRPTLVTTQLLETKCGLPITVQAALDRQADRASASATTTSTTIERKALRDEPLPSPHHPEPAARRSIRPTDSTHYQSLLSFYRKQLADEEADRGTALGLGAPSSSSAAAAGLGSSTGYSSPSAFSRIMNLYSTSGSATASAGAGAGGMGQHAGAARRLTKKAEPMRDARTEAEGLRLVDFEEEERVAQRMWRLEGEEQGGYDGVVAQTEDMAAREPSSLRPQNILLATRRSKRCRICRHILVKPEAKLSSSRYKIRLLAQNYLPSITARLLTPNTAPVPSPNPSTKPSMTNSTSISTTGLITAALPRLVPGRASQHTITFQNPRFDPLSIRLAAPTHVPGPPSFSLTILCPQFEVGANADLWDEALLEPGGVERGVGGVGTGARGVMGEGKGERRRTAEEKGDGQRSDVGSVWERGRNWTSVVFEVVPDAKPPPPPPAPIPQPAPSTSTSTPAAAGLPTAEATAETPKKPPLLPPRPTSGGGGMKGVLEVPVFVKMAWKGETAAGTERGGAGAGTGGREGGQGGKEEEEEEERTVEFWCAIPLGTVG